MSANWLAASASEAEWQERLCADRSRADANQTPSQRTLTATVLERALDLGADAFVLTGSTARDSRAAGSDLDYHVVGTRPRTDDLPGEIDVVATSATRFRMQLLAGDDFVQWTLRYGCILHDGGVLRDGARLVLERCLWPSAARKLASIPDHRRETDRLLRMGDREAAQEQLRAMTTTAARALLLAVGEFPLARRELPSQLSRTGHDSLARALSWLISGEPDLAQLAWLAQIADTSLTALNGRSAA